MVKRDYIIEVGQEVNTFYLYFLLPGIISSPKCNILTDDEARGPYFRISGERRLPPWVKAPKMWTGAFMVEYNLPRDVCVAPESQPTFGNGIKYWGGYVVVEFKRITAQVRAPIIMPDFV